MRIDRSTTYYRVVEEIARVNFYGDVSVDTLHATLNHLTLQQITRALRHARELRWIKYADSYQVYLTRKGRKAYPAYDPYPTPKAATKRRRKRKYKRNASGRLVPR